MDRTTFLTHLSQLQQALDHVQPFAPFSVSRSPHAPTPEALHSLVALQMTAAQICDDIFLLLDKADKKVSA